MKKNIQDVLGRLRAYHPEGKEECLFDNQYGHFANGGREFVITNPHTPGLWANFLTNGKYTAFLTPTGGGYSWEQESGFNRVLREHPLNHLTGDTPGRYVYIKDTETNDFWSATYQPVKKSTSFEAVHSLGWTSSSCTYDEIYSQITYFVPMGTTHEIWKLKLKNNSARKRTLKLYTYAEFVLGNYRPDLLENSFNGLFNRGERYHNSLLFTKTILSTKDNLVTSLYDKIGFFTASEKFTEYELSRRDFIGFGSSLDNPKMLVENIPLSSKPRASENLISCMSFEIVLKPGEEKEIYFALGTADQKKEIDTVTASLTKQKVGLQLKTINSFWTSYIKKVWIETPDEGLNIWFNYWLKYQAYFNAQWSEMDSFYIGGGGGFGFRDTAQHIWGVLPFEKDINLKHLTFLLSHQYPNGNVPHGVSIFTNESVYSPHSDDPCWLVFAVLNYLEETGEYAFLDRVIGYAETAKFGAGHSGSVLNHIIRATDYSLRHMSERLEYL
jgi:cellobiose phosphorylase